MIFSKFRGGIYPPNPPPLASATALHPNKYVAERTYLEHRQEEAEETSEVKLCSFSKLSVTSPTSQLILQPFLRFTYVPAHSPTLPLFHLRHSSFSNPSFASSTSQAELILQPFRHFTYVTTHFPTLPSLYLRHSSFSNPSVASPTSHARHVLHLASRPCIGL